MRRALVTLAAIAALSSSGGARAADSSQPLAPDTYRDDGVDRPFTATYEESYRQARRRPHYLRAAVENIALLGIGVAWYWYNKDANRVDWDYSNVASRFKHLEVRFDTNSSGMNFFNHPLGGAFFYGAARRNGLGILESFGYAVASSTTYEFLLEWREKPSINDLIVTPVGGLAIGEFLVHFGDYVHSAPHGGRTIHRVLSYPLGLGNHLYPGYHAVDALPPDSLGYSSYFAHRFDLMIGTSRASNNASDSGSLHTAEVDAQVIAIPGLLKPGHFAINFSDGNFTEARGRFGYASGQSLIDLLFDANLVGRYAQDITHKGIASMFALNTSFRYFRRDVLDRRDFYGIAHLVGPAFKLWSLHGAFVAKLEGSVHLDFAGIRSLAYQPWVEQFGSDGTKSTLQMQNYDYSYGGSARARGSLAYGGLELTTEAFVGRYGSFDRWDRFQENVTRNVHTSDGIVEVRAALAWKLPSVPLQLRVYGDHLGRVSEMAPVTVRRWDRLLGLDVGLRF